MGKRKLCNFLAYRVTELISILVTTGELNSGPASVMFLLRPTAMMTLLRLSVRRHGGLLAFSTGGSANRKNHIVRYDWDPAA